MNSPNKSKKPTKKLVTIGDAQVGKSSLLFRVTHKKMPNMTSSTVGAAFYCTNIKHCCLHMWDTAGQERFRSMVPVYLRDTDVILFVYDITDRGSFDHLKNYWVNFAITYSTTSSSSSSSSSFFGDKKPVRQSTPRAPESPLPSESSALLRFNRRESLSQISQIPQTSQIPQAQNKIPNQIGHPLASSQQTMTEELSSDTTETGKRLESQRLPFCIIVANKSDLDDDRVVSSEEGIQLAKKVNAHFIELSALNGNNTEKLMDLIDRHFDTNTNVQPNISQSMQSTNDNDNDNSKVIILDNKNFVTNLLPNNCNC